MMWVRAAAHCKELHAAWPLNTAPLPREVGPGTAGTEKASLWNNENFIKVKSNGIWFF